jgi:hypothetical protein
MTFTRRPDGVSCFAVMGKIEKREWVVNCLAGVAVLAMALNCPAAAASLPGGYPVPATEDEKIGGRENRRTRKSADEKIGAWHAGQFRRHAPRDPATLEELERGHELDLAARVGRENSERRRQFRRDVDDHAGHGRYRLPQGPKDQSRQVTRLQALRPNAPRSRKG